jgi:hypothetical protein
MKPNKIRVLVFFAAAFALTASSVMASDPVGIYAVVERVVMEPGDNAPQRIQVWGAFALADGRSGDGYLAAQRGYLYYTLQPGKEEICKKEWADLKAIAGTGQGIGFGARYQPKGRIRKASEKPEAPETYPIGIGIQRMGSQHNQPNIITQLKEALRTL